MSRRVFVAVVSAFAVAGCSQSIPSALEERPALSVGEFVVGVSVRQALPIPWAGWQGDPAFLPAALPVDEAVKVVLDELHAKWAEEKAAADAEAVRLEAEAQANQGSNTGGSKGSSGGGSKGGSSGGSKGSSGGSSGGNSGGGDTGGNAGRGNTGEGPKPGGGNSDGGTQPVQVPCGTAPCQTANVVTADDGAASSFCSAINNARSENGLATIGCSVGKQSDAVAMANNGKTGGHGFTISTANGPGVGSLMNSQSHRNWILSGGVSSASVGCAKRTYTVYSSLGNATDRADMFCGARFSQ